MTQQSYIRAVRNVYFQLPNTHRSFSRSDRGLASAFYKRGIPFDVVRSALLLATARRLCRDPTATPLPPVRSLHYFVPALEEILLQPLPRGYLQYLEYKIAERQ